MSSVLEPVDQGEAADQARPAREVLQKGVRVVGIGASAGGLEALRVLVRTLPTGAGACFAIAQHLSPSHRSMLVSLLAREATVTVIEISDGMVPEADCVYVTPSTCHVRFADGAFRLESASQAGIPKPSIDEFFTSLASAFEVLSIGVVLSGTGSDGGPWRAGHPCGGRLHAGAGSGAGQVRRHAALGHRVGDAWTSWPRSKNCRPSWGAC